MQDEWEAQNHIETLTENWHMACPQQDLEVCTQICRQGIWY